MVYNNDLTYVQHGMITTKFSEYSIISYRYRIKEKYHFPSDENSSDFTLLTTSIYNIEQTNRS